MNFDVGNAGTSVNGAWDTNTPANATGFPGTGLNVQPGGTLFYSNIHNVTRTITLGDSFVLSESLSVGASSKPACQASSSAACLNDDSGSVDVDFGNSSYWNGITSIAVRDPGTGLFETKDLSLFSLSANSGTDYFQSFVPAPVPLPAALWLFAPALGVIARRWRRTV